MCPRVCNCRVIDGTNGNLTVYFVCVELICFAHFKSLGVNTKVQEGLRGYLIDVISGGVSVNTVEELIVLAGNNSGIARAELVVKVAVFIIIYGIVGDEQSGGNEAFLILQHSLAASERAVGVACNANSFSIYKGEGGEVFYAVIKAVGVVFIVPPGVGFDHLGVTVSVHANGKNNVSAASVFNVIEVLHFTVVVPAVANNNRRGFLLGGCGFGHEQKSIKFVSAFGNKGHVMVFDGTEIGLEEACANGAEKTN